MYLCVLLFLQKVLTLVLLTATVPEVFVANMTTFLSDYYYDVEETLTHINSLKLKTIQDITLNIAVHNLSRR